MLDVIVKVEMYLPLNNNSGASVESVLTMEQKALTQWTAVGLPGPTGTPTVPGHVEVVCSIESEGVPIQGKSGFIQPYLSPSHSR